MRRFVITVRLKPNLEEEVRQILGEGPPFELEDTGFESHTVFLAPDQPVFLFEGERAEEEAAKLLERSQVLEEASRLGALIEGEPSIPYEVFSWHRIPELEGFSFGPRPGPGDSEGGGSD
jgi:hypothetical protein